MDGRLVCWLPLMVLPEHSGSAHTFQISEPQVCIVAVWLCAVAQSPTFPREREHSWCFISLPTLGASSCFCCSDSDGCHHGSFGIFLGIFLLGIILLGIFLLADGVGPLVG